MTGEKPHLWVRAEQRENERRTGLMPDGAARLSAAGGPGVPIGALCTSTEKPHSCGASSAVLTVSRAGAFVAVTST